MAVAGVREDTQSYVAGGLVSCLSLGASFSLALAVAFNQPDRRRFATIAGVLSILLLAMALFTLYLFSLLYPLFLIGIVPAATLASAVLLRQLPGRQSD